MDKLNVHYFAPKLWLYVMIWLPQTTDNSKHFAQSLEIWGIKSRLYHDFKFKYDILDPFTRISKNSFSPKFKTFPFLTSHSKKEN